MIEPRIKPCDECFDQTFNAGYHIDSKHEVPYLAHKHLDPEQFKQPIFLDVGAGGYSNLEGFTSVDLYTEADIRAPMWEIPLPSGSVEGIACQNALEHVQKSMVVPTIREFNRLLRVGGKIELMVPDLEWACEWFLKRPTNEWDMDIIYGNQNHPGEFHLTGFTQKLLLDYFTESAQDKVSKWFVESITYLFGDVELKEKINEDNYKVNVTQRVIVVKADKI